MTSTAPLLVCSFALVQIHSLKVSGGRELIEVEIGQGINRNILINKLGWTRSLELVCSSPKGGQEFWEVAEGMSEMKTAFASINTENIGKQMLRSFPRQNAALFLTRQMIYTENGKRVV